MSTLTQHPLSAAFPAMSPVDLSALTDDIATHGLRQPVVTFEGQVLDGWHRYQACLHAEVKPALVEFTGDDPVAFVLSLNLSRRHLTESQRSSLVVSCQSWRASSVRGDSSHPSATVAEMAKQADVSERSIQRAKVVERAGLSRPVLEGKASLATAETVSKLPPKEREKVTAKPPEDWQEALERKSTPKEVEVLEEVSDNAQRMAELAGDFEAALKIIESNDPLAEAWAEVKALSAKLEDLNRLYDAKCRELATMTAEAKRHHRRAVELEKQIKAAS